MSMLAIPIGLLIIVFFLVIFLASRYKRCPSDRILVVYGKVGTGRSANCIHGGGAMVWPVIQDYAYLTLTPMTISIPLQGALSLQNIRINVPSTFTVGVSVEPSIMNNAAERLLHLGAKDVEEMAGEIIFGQLRLTVASLTIEQINQDRESFLESIRKNVEPELNKIGLYLINVNITDITDSSNYIESIGKKAASEAINRAVVDVAVQDKQGAIGQAEANREKEIRVAESVAGSEKGQKQAEADRRVFVQQQEAEAIMGEEKARAEQRIFVRQQESGAMIGEAVADRERDVGVAESAAEAEKGKKKAEADRRVYVQHQEAEAVSGENTAKAEIASSEADLDVKQAEARRQGEVAKRQAQVAIQKAQYEAEQQRLKAEEIVREEIDKQKVEIAADAEAERVRRTAKGQADAVLFQYEAEAKGLRQLLESKAEGYQSLVQSCAGDARAAGTLLMIEKLDGIVAKQVEAIKNLKIDKVTVWDSGGADGKGGSTAGFVSSLIKSLPPLHDVAAMAGVELPEYLGQVTSSGSGAVTPATPAAPAATEADKAPKS